MQVVGFGYDSHRFAPDRALVLAGVRIEHDLGLAGHSDADAILHALTDAVLGAVGEEDIGEHFRDDDPQWAGADSARFLSAAMAMAAKRGFRPVHADVTVLAEQPKLGPYKPAMRQRVAKVLGLDAAHVAIKAKTNEGMGFVGRGEGIAVLAVVTMTDE